MRKFKHVNPANPFLSGVQAVKQCLNEIGPMKISKDERLREIRFLINQALMEEHKRVKAVDRYIDRLMTEGKIDTPELEKLRDIIAEVGWALAEFKQSTPLDQLDNIR